MSPYKSVFLRRLLVLPATLFLAYCGGVVLADEYLPFPELDDMGIYDGEYTAGELIRHGLASPPLGADGEASIAQALGIADELFGRDSKKPELGALRDSWRETRSDNMRRYLGTEDNNLDYLDQYPTQPAYTQSQSERGEAAEFLRNEAVKQSYMERISRALGVDLGRP
jgi:hypothetical protein